MTKAKTTTRPANAAAQPKISTSTAEAKSKRPRGKTVAANTGSANVPTAVAPTERPAETPITDATPAATLKLPRQTKAALLRARLGEPGGVSLAALIEVTGWQAHTLRAYLGGLRKEGLTLTRRREGDDTIYAIDQSSPKTTAAAGESAAQKAEASGITSEATAEAASAMQDASSLVHDAASATQSAESIA